MLVDIIGTLLESIGILFVGVTASPLIPIEKRKELQI